MVKTARKRSLFFDTIENKVDTKGRVSVPADYRSLIDQQETILVAYPSFTAPCIECSTLEEMNAKFDALENTYDEYSPEREALTNRLYANSKEFEFDSTGRIMLTQKFLSHAGIEEKALFVGKGKTFQIWNPDNYRQEEERLEAFFKTTPLTLKTGGAK